MFVLPLVNKKVPKEWAYIDLFISAAFVWVYIRHKKQIETEDAIQLVIGAPRKGQVSITNPNSPSAARKSSVPVPVRVKRVRPRKVRKTRTRTRTFADTFIKSTPTPTTSTPTLGGNILNTLGPSLIGTQKYLEGRTTEFTNDFVHPQTGFHTDVH